MNHPLVAGWEKAGPESRLDSDHLGMGRKFEGEESWIFSPFQHMSLSPGRINDDSFTLKQLLELTWGRCVRPNN